MVYLIIIVTSEVLKKIPTNTHTHKKKIFIHISRRNKNLTSYALYIQDVLDITNIGDSKSCKSNIY